MEIRTSLTEQFMNWYATHTTLYFRKNKAIEGSLTARLDDVVVVWCNEWRQLSPFFAPIDTELAHLHTDLSRVTQERDELRKWLDSLESADVAQLQPSTDGERSDLWLFDSVLLYSFYDVNESVVGMQNINEEFANWVAAIRERSKP